MRPLTDAQAALAAANRGLALWAVGRLPASVIHRHGGPDAALAEAEFILCKAAAGFDPTRGFKFSTYAGDALLRGLWRASPRRELLLGVSLDTPTPGGLHGHDLPARPEAPGLEADAVAALRAAVAELPPLQRRVIERVVLGGATLTDAARHLGISRDRASKVRRQALAVLRRRLAEVLGEETNDDGDLSQG